MSEKYESGAIECFIINNLISYIKAPVNFLYKFLKQIQYYYKINI
jgi:hypothetical protein